MIVIIGVSGPGMATPTQLSKPSKVVIACLDGQRLKGFIFNFSALRDQFRLFPQENSHQNEGKEVKVDSVKAVFFVKDFAGHREHKDSYHLQDATHGRKVEVTFHDGEKVLGTTEAYNPKKIGFFIFPADPECNNTRVFVVNKSVREVKLL